MDVETLSVIVPCYNEEPSLPLFYEAIVNIAEEMSYVTFEFIFIDDGSTDDTLSVMRNLAQRDKRVRYVSFTRNFGKESGMIAGLEAARGDYVVIMDADLQHPPSLLPEMYRAVTEEGYDCAATYRATRKGEGWLHTFLARKFYRLVNRISDTTIRESGCDFRLMRRSMVDSILSLREYNRFSKGIFGWVGYRTKWIPFENVERVAGQTKWSYWSLFLYSLEGITAFSTTPLALASVMGFLLFAVAFLYICVILVKTLVFGDPVSGWPSMMCVILFLGGLQLFAIGILGQYLSKIYLEVKNRPHYLVRETEEGIK